MEEPKEAPLEGLSQKSKQQDFNKLAHYGAKGGEKDWDKRKGMQPPGSLSHQFNKKLIAKSRSYAALPRSRETFDARGPIG